MMLRDQPLENLMKGFATRLSRPSMMQCTPMTKKKVLTIPNLKLTGTLSKQTFVFY
jgi:hypothetical protein